jgi:hypothetical protein
VDAQQAYRTTAGGRAPLRRRHARVLQETNQIKQDEIAARQVHALRHYYVGKLRLTDVIDMFNQIGDET